MIASFRRYGILLAASFVLLPGLCQAAVETPPALKVAMKTAIDGVCSPVVRQKADFMKSVEASTLPFKDGSDDEQWLALHEIPPDMFVAVGQMKTRPETCSLLSMYSGRAYLKPMVLDVLEFWGCPSNPISDGDGRLLFRCADSRIRLRVFVSDDDDFVLVMLFESETAPYTALPSNASLCPALPVHALNLMKRTGDYHCADLGELAGGVWPEHAQ